MVDTEFNAPCYRGEIASVFREVEVTTEAAVFA